MPEETWDKSQRILSILASLSCRNGNLLDYLEAIARGVSEIIEMDWTVVTLCHENEEQLVASNLEIRPEDRVCDLYGTVTHTVFVTKQPLCIEDVRVQPEFGELPEGYLSYLGVPLCTPQDEVIGTICSFNMAPKPHALAKIETVKLFAERAATALDNFFLYQKEQNFRQRLATEIAKRTAELEQAQARLVEQARLAAIGEFASMIVHELRNPLTTVKMGLNYFSKLELSDAARERLHLARDEARRLEMLLSEILLYARPQTLNLEQINLNTLGMDIQPVLEDLPEVNQRQICWQFWPEPAWIRGDKDKLKQVLFNVIQNACEAAPPASQVTCAIAQPEPDYFTITVHNWGEPISATELPKLTQPFYSRKPGGTGLGLAIVERILTAHRGKLQLTSNPQQGTLVSIHLPTNWGEAA